MNQKEKNAPHFKIHCCNNCTHRSVRCHITCRLYQGWVRENQRRLKAERVNCALREYIAEQKGK